MKRPSKFDGEGKSPASDRLPSPSSGPPLGSNRLIPFPGAAAAKGRDTEGAGVSSASASSTFVPLGNLTHSVVLRLQGGFPKIRGPARLMEERPAAPVDQSAPEGSDPR